MGQPTPGQSQEPDKLGTKSSPDPIYRAAILAACDLDSESVDTRAAAGLAIASALDRLGVSATLNDKNPARPASTLLVVDGTDGVLVTVAGDEKPADALVLARSNHWARIHHVHFTPRTVTIKTLAA